MATKKEILERTGNFEDFKRSVESNERRPRNSNVSDKVHKHLKEKYGSYSAGINLLALKDMGEL